jgi:hypothetical protein
MDKANSIKLGDFAGWRCASCNQRIPSIDDGWVEWLASEADDGITILHGVRLVHRHPVGTASSEHGCRYDAFDAFRTKRSVVEGLAVERFIGPDGLMLLLSFLGSGEFPKEEVLELAKRVQIPGYEMVRDLFPAAIASGVCTPFLGDTYYLQSEIRELLTWATEQAKVA